MTDEMTPARPEETLDSRYDPAGWIADGAFHYPIRIYYAETDAGGVVYHGQYLALAERARTEMLRQMGLPLDRFIDLTGCIFVVRSASLDYRAPARLDDLVVCRIQSAPLGTTKMPLTQTFLKGDTVLCEVSLVLVCVNERWRPTRVPDILRERLAPILTKA